MHVADRLLQSRRRAAAGRPGDVRWRSSSGFDFATDQFYFDDVEICVANVTDADVTLNVDESDPDFPPGAVLTTVQRPTDRGRRPGRHGGAGDVGYRQPELIFTKTSNAENNEVSPGQTVTYTMEITNNTGATQTGITLIDPLPTGTTYVAGSSPIVLPTTPLAVRVTVGSDDAEQDSPAAP